MTVNNPTKSVTSVGNNSAFEHPFSPMKIYASTDLQVTLVTISTSVETLLTEGSGAANYSVSVAEYPGTGKVIYPADRSTPMTTDQKIVMKRVLPLLQKLNLENQGGYNPDTLEEFGLDKLLIIDLQQQEQIDRSIAFVISADLTSFDPEIPTPVNNAGKVLAINTAGTGWEFLTPNTSVYLTLPGASTDHAIPRFDGTVGTVFLNSGILIDDSDQISGVVAINGVAIGDYLIAGNLGVTVQAYDADTAKTDTDQSWTGSQRSPFIPLTTGAVDFNAGQNFVITPAADITIAFSNLADGQDGTITIDNTGGGASSFTWPGSGIDWGGQGQPVIGSERVVLTYSVQGSTVDIRKWT